MTEDEYDALLEVLDLFGDANGSAGGQACFHAARAIRQLRAELDDIKGDNADAAYNSGAE